MPQRKPINPFYVAALPVGVIFALTACSYMVMAYRGLDPHQRENSGLVWLMDEHGMTIIASVRNEPDESAAAISAKR